MVELHKTFDVVTDFHADPEGNADATPAFRTARAAALASAAAGRLSVIQVPPGPVRICAGRPASHGHKVRTEP